MRVCVLQPDYSASSVHYSEFDPPRDLAPLVPEWTVDHLFLAKASVYRQLRDAAARGYGIFVNLCEGYLDWDVPSIDVILSLEALNQPYTGPSPRLYDPSKQLMKHVAGAAGVSTPAWVQATSEANCEEAVARLRFPMFVKPAHAGDSLGIDEESLVDDGQALLRKVRAVISEFGSALIEEYIPGRECTVLVAADPESRFCPVALMPIEFRFPHGARFKTYRMKVQEHHPDCNVPVPMGELSDRLQSAARSVFTAFHGQGYARLDFRVDRDGVIHFLDINFTCSMFYPEGFEGSADYILRADPMGASGFLRHIVNEGIERHRRRQRSYHSGSTGICAARAIAKGEVVIRGEEREHRLVTLEYVNAHWPASAVDAFRRSALPLGGGVYVQWSEDPGEWTMQRHSCHPNTAYCGLNLIALQDIGTGQALTLDYGACRDETLPPFKCRCGAPQCRGWVAGRPGTSIARR